MACSHDASRPLPGAVSSIWRRTGHATVSAAAPLCRVLYGKMRVRSYDWEATDQEHPELPFSPAGASAWARQVLDLVAEPHHQPAALFPASGGNIHEFTAVEGSQCAVLDVLAPPYDIAGGEASPEQRNKPPQHLSSKQTAGQERSLLLLWKSLCVLR